MELFKDGHSLGHLTYCSNIHPGESWTDVDANLRRHIPVIRDAMQPGDEFGIGLRLSAAAARTLAAPTEIARLKSFLAESNTCIFTLNGFPYGPFHGTRVKEDVYLPDWQDPERLRYTNELADILAALLPDNRHGSISTVPGAFKARATSISAIDGMAGHVVDHAAHLVKLERDTGRRILLALEPEPCCFLETIAETVDFFRDHLHGQRAAERLQQHIGGDLDDAAMLLRRHLTLCLDICHAAIEFEDCDACLDALDAAGIVVGKLQISAGLRLDPVTPSSVELLRPFIDDTYLHQVVSRQNGTLTRYVDLPDAIAELDDGHGKAVEGDSLQASHPEWRVHFHVPVFLDDLGDFSSTQFFIRETLARHARKPISDHLEVETYTWDVLPPRYRTDDVNTAIVRELSWVRDVLCST